KLMVTGGSDNPHQRVWSGAECRFNDIENFLVSGMKFFEHRQGWVETIQPLPMRGKHENSPLTFPDLVLVARNILRRYKIRRAGNHASYGAKQRIVGLTLAHRGDCDLRVHVAVAEIVKRCWC